MLCLFLANNRAILIARCIEKVAQGPKRAATAEQLKNGIPMFIDQLTRTLKAEHSNENATSLEIFGPAGGDTSNLSEMGLSATAHGKALLHLGCTVDQVVHDYGDLCQAITDLACERDAPFNIDEYRRLNRCFDNVMADAVTKFSAQRDVAVTAEQSLHENEQLGFLIHELRNVLGTASLAVRAMEMGSLTLAGATGSVLKRSLASWTSSSATHWPRWALKIKESGIRNCFRWPILSPKPKPVPIWMRPRGGAFSPWPKCTLVWASRSTTS